jgi:methionine aminopeptidase
MGIQDFGGKFQLDKLIAARSVARDLAYELSSHITPGMTEEDAHKIYKELCSKFPLEKQWHPAKLRFGPNTLCQFKDVSVPYILGEEDVFFIDIGPVIDGHEADYGETFTVGKNFDHRNIAETSKKVFQEVADFWKIQRCTGEELYLYAQERAEFYGYELSMGSDGHRIGDFPHHIHFKGGMPEVMEEIIPNAWILEIHLHNREKTFGAFFEDILTDEELDLI